MIVLVALFVATSGAVTDSPSHFESADGNMVLNTSGNTDWNCFANGGSSNTSGFVTSGINTGTGTCAKTTGATAVTADANGEVTWVKGQKFDTECPALDNKSTPPKDDFTNVAEYEEFATSGPSSGDLFFYGAAIRSTANGNASGDVEFNQSAGDGTTTAGCRTAGDRLVAYDFLNGGTSLDFHILTWIDSSAPNGGGNSGKCFVKQDSMPCWGANVITPTNQGATITFDGETNQSAIAAADNGISGTAVVAQQLAEFGVNLTDALGGGPLPCFPQQVWESRSSGSSFTSSPEDTEFVNLTTCGALSILKTSSKAAHTALSGATFQVCTNNGPYTLANPCSPAKSGSDSLVTGSDGTVCLDSLAPGNYYVSEKSAPTGYSRDDTTIHSVAAQSGATCSGGTTPTPLTFRDTPLTDLTVHVASQVTGGTQSRITCTGPSPGTSNIGNSPQPSASTFGDPETMTANGLSPGTYSCTVIIDP